MFLKERAGIAQLVEQATENRRVPSSNLGPGIRTSIQPLARETLLRMLWSWFFRSKIRVAETFHGSRS